MPSSDDMRAEERVPLNAGGDALLGNQPCPRFSSESADDGEEDSDDAMGLRDSSLRSRSGGKRALVVAFMCVGLVASSVLLFARPRRPHTLNEDKANIVARGMKFEDFQRALGWGVRLDEDLDRFERTGGLALDLNEIRQNPAHRLHPEVVTMADRYLEHTNDHLGTNFTSLSALSQGTLRWPGESCYLSADQRCLVDRFKRNQWTQIFPGGRTRCISDLRPEYSFQVIPGDVDKLLFYFQGGGACWNEGSTKMYFCRIQPFPTAMKGVFDRTNLANPYRDWWVVHVGYCSGDEHGGDVARPYKGAHGEGIEQRGFWNTRAAIDWTLEQLKGRELEYLVVGGSSAGSMGSMLWARTLLTDFQYKSAACLLDSYAGVFPPGVLTKTLQELGLCNTGIFNDAQTANCWQGTLQIPDAFSEIMGAFPDVVFASIDSKADMVQQVFYDALKVSMVALGGLISGQEFWDKMSVIFQFYKAHNPNHIFYLVNEAQHTFLDSNHLYDKHANLPSCPTVADFIKRLPQGLGGVPKSHCQPFQKAPQRPHSGHHAQSQPLLYCPPDLTTDGH